MPDQPNPASTAPAPLLAEFAAVTRAGWKALVEAELKGAPFEKKMLTPTPLQHTMAGPSPTARQ